MSDSEDDYASSGHSSSDDEDDKHSNNAPIMSIFASYYGIEDPTTTANDQQSDKDSIDEVNFNPDKYVRHLLLNEPIEALVTKDAELVHEIRTLDGEMQKLVYDNYNKFINATETIKEMKNGVFRMDQDMDSVKQNLDKITASSKDLDGVLDDKRAKVDKLVRVKRLLERLEFLSELPERLSKMIDQKMYKEAVQLYNKTISVLTRHSHVLSFKNIKERTELMMADLTEKVIDLLEDPTLEAVKLTQYVGVLHLMKAPRHKVMTKLLAAHQHRSIRMITEFNEKFQKANASTTTTTVAGAKGSSASTTPSTTTSAATAASTSTYLQDLATARQFHQNVLVGLIEACKGIFELYDPNQSNRGGGGGGNATPSTTVVETVTPKDITQAYELLRQMISLVMKEYTKSFTNAFHSFFNHFHTLFHTQDPMEFSTLLESHELETLEEMKKQVLMMAKDAVLSVAATSATTATAASSSSSAVNATTTTTTANVNLLELYEERTSWLMLARQAILDVLYLDSTLRDTASRQLGITFKDSSSSGTVSVNASIPNYGNVFSDAILQEVHKHNTNMRKIFINHFVKHIESYWLPKIALLTHGQDRLMYFHQYPQSSNTIGMEQKKETTTTAMSTGGDHHGGLSSHSSHGGQQQPQSTSTSTAPVVTMNGRTILQQQCTMMSHFFHIMKSQCLETFHECLRFYKPVLDIYEAIGREQSMFLLLCSELTSAFVTDFLQVMTWSSLSSCQMKINYTGGGGHHSENGSSHGSSQGRRNKQQQQQQQQRKSASLPSKSFDHDDEMDEHGGDDDDDDDEHNPFVDEIFDSEAYEKVVDTNKTKNVSNGEKLFSHLRVQHSIHLVYAAILRQFSSIFETLINDDLLKNGFPSLEEAGQKDICIDAMTNTSRILATSFLEDNSHYATELAMEIHNQIYLENAISSGSAASNNNAVSIRLSSGSLQFATYLDQLMQLSCLLLGDSPPSPPTNASREAARRSSVVRQGSTTHSALSNHSLALQMDIERLFAAKIRVFEDVPMDFSSEFLMNVVIKASVKGTQETIRTMTFPYTAYLQVQANAAFVKQIAACLVRDTQGVDNLLDQLLTTNFSRYLGANDIASASDHAEIAAVNKAINEAFSFISDTVLLVMKVGRN